MSPRFTPILIVLVAVASVQASSWDPRALAVLGFTSPPSQEPLEHRVEQRVAPLLIEIATTGRGTRRLAAILSAFETLGATRFVSPLPIRSLSPDRTWIGDFGKFDGEINLSQSLAARLLLASAENPEFVAYAREWLAYYEKNKGHYPVSSEATVPPLTGFLKALLRARDEALNQEIWKSLALERTARVEQQFTSAIARALSSHPVLDSAPAYGMLLDAAKVLFDVRRGLVSEELEVLNSVDSYREQFALRAMSLAKSARELAEASTLAFPTVDTETSFANQAGLRNWLAHLDSSAVYRDHYGAGLEKFLVERLTPEKPFYVNKYFSSYSRLLRPGVDPKSRKVFSALLRNFPGLSVSGRAKVLRAYLRQVDWEIKLHEREFQRMRYTIAKGMVFKPKNLVDLENDRDEVKGAVKELASEARREIIAQWFRRQKKRITCRLFGELPFEDDQSQY